METWIRIAFGPSYLWHPGFTQNVTRLTLVIQNPALSL